MHDSVAILYLALAQIVIAVAQVAMATREEEDLAENPCVFLPLEESVRLTDDQCIFRGEFVPTVQNSRPNAALMVLLPVCASRVRFVAFDIVIDSHADSDIELSSS